MWLYRAKTMNTHTLLLHIKLKGGNHGEKTKQVTFGNTVHSDRPSFEAQESESKSESYGWRAEASRKVNRSRTCRAGVEKQT